jgi:hypothetical protein
MLKREENFFFENQFRVYVLFGPPLLSRKVIFKDDDFYTMEFS